MDAIICKANVNLPMETSHKVRFFKFAQWKLKKSEGLAGDFARKTREEAVRWIEGADSAGRHGERLIGGCGGRE